MSAHGGGNKVISYLSIAGLVIVGIAFLYDLYGWTFLTDTHVISQQSRSTSKGTSDTSTPLHKVVGVIGGDTLIMNIDGNEIRVKLLGINTPENIDPAGSGTGRECFAVESNKRLKNLVEGENVTIETDDSQDTYDTYGRMLAYVYLPDGQMVNRKMIAEGYAYEYTYFKPYKHQQEFRDLQNLAKASSRGLWSDDACK